MLDDDVLIVGAGLAGLAAALELQSRGRKVRVLEARDQPGGLCSTEEWDGLEYAIACNDFAGGLVARCRAAGVEQDFREVRSRFVIGGDGAERDYAIPPRPGSSGPWLRRLPEIIRLGLALRRQAKNGPGDATLGDILDRIAASDELRGLCGIAGYAYGMPSKEIAVEALFAEFSPDYRYETGRSFVPEGGPQHLANALVRRVENLGARIQLGTTVHEVLPEANGFVVETDAGSHHARFVLTSDPAAAKRPSEAGRPGLSPYTLRIRLGPGTRIPPHLHTIARLPGPTETFIPDLRRGRLPERFGFHFFPCETPTRDGARAANILFFSPSGIDRMTGDEEKRAVDACLGGLDELVPGLASSIEAWDLVPPSRIERRSGLDLSVVPHMRSAGEPKPPALDPATGIARIGTRYGPPGDHAGAAWLSGIWAARDVLRAPR